MNPASKLTNYIEGEIQKYSEIPLDQTLTEKQQNNLDQLKAALAIVNSLKGRSPGHVGRQLDDIRRSLENITFDPVPYYDKEEESVENPEAPKKKEYTASELYLNEKVQDLFKVAEIERLDYRNKENPPNVFFGKFRFFQFPLRSEKPWFAFEIATLRLNLIAMFVFLAVAFFLLRTALGRQLKKV